MNIPVYIIAFNNPTYVEMTVSQLINLEVSKIVVVDNNSTYPPLLEYYDKNKGKFQLIRMDQNYGHNVVTKCFYDHLPEVFAITDPDLKFNPELPKNFLEQLYELSVAHNAYKVGMSLDISEPHLFNKRMRFFGESIEGWERRFWISPIEDEKYQLYNAEIDTTFAVYNKKNISGNKQIRVAGNFTAKHLPWYLAEKIPSEEREFYLKTKNTGAWVQSGIYTLPPSKRYLIISPQAGFGNRIRALCAGILLAKQTGRIPLYFWEPETGISNSSHVSDIKRLGWKDYFLQHNDFQQATLQNMPKVDAIFSEWAPGDYWYSFQYTAQQKWKSTKFNKVNLDLNILSSPEYINDEVVLLETSLCVSLSAQAGGCKNTEEFKLALSNIYKTYFEPTSYFSELLSKIPDIDIGISVRRGDLLQYFPEANQDPTAILKWCIGLIKNTEAKNIVIFSADSEFKDDFKAKLKNAVSVNFIEVPNLKSWEQAFLEFLILAEKCTKIYGTPMSSFTEEAGLFRGKIHYSKILTPIVEEIKLDMDKEILPAITIAILCKDKAHVLPLYLKCIYSLYYPKDKIYLYIRTNDNKDQSVVVLKKWINHVKNEYADIYYNDSSISDNLKKYQSHDWNAERFSILGKIRQDSIRYAIEKETDYFVIDCDNFVKAHTLYTLVRSKKSVIGPFLRLISHGSSVSMYSNFHADISSTGYHIDNKNYNDIWAQVNPSIHEVNVIHCTYYIKNEVLGNVNYFDNTNHHEYVIFSRNLRNCGIKQYIDNREIYGLLTFDDTEEQFNKNFTLDIAKQLLL